MEEGYSSKAVNIYNIAMFFFTGIFVFIFSFLTGKSYDLIIRNTIVSLIFSGTVVFMLMDDQKRGKAGFYYDNYYKRHRFFIAFIVMVVLSCVFSLVSNVLWPYMSFFVLLALFSNFETGLVSGIGFVTISIMLEKSGSYHELIMYVLAGVIALVLLRDPEQKKGIALPVIISLMMQAVLLSVFSILFSGERLSAGLLMLPVLNVMTNMVMMFVFLNFVSVYVIGNSDGEDEAVEADTESDPMTEEPGAGDDNLEDAKSEETRSGEDDSKEGGPEESRSEEGGADEAKPEDDKIKKDSGLENKIEVKTESENAMDAPVKEEAKAPGNLPDNISDKPKEADYSSQIKERTAEESSMEQQERPAVPKKKRGRPKKKVLSMTLNVENEVQAEFDFDENDLAYEVAECVLKMEGCSDDVEVELVITDDEGIQELNRDFRKIDAPTDVLSFPNVSYDEAGDFSVLSGEQRIDLINPDTGKIMFGEIVINENRIRSQAVEYGHSEKREFAFLIAHSMLHLCGYDHMEEDEAKVMEDKQEQALSKLGITRD